MVALVKMSGCEKLGGMIKQTTYMQEPPLTYNDAEFWKLVGGGISYDGRKVRSDAILKNLSPEAQEQVVNWSYTVPEHNLTGDVVRGTGGIIKAVRELGYIAETLQRPELAVSATAIGRFVKWWELREQMEVAAERMEEMCQEMDAAEVAKLRQASEVLLLKLGIAEGNVKLIVAAARMQDSRRKLELRERKFELQREKLLVEIKDMELDFVEKRYNKRWLVERLREEGMIDSEFQEESVAGGG